MSAHQCAVWIRETVSCLFTTHLREFAILDNLEHRQMLFLSAHQYLKPCTLECVSSTSINSVIKSGLGVSNCLDMVTINSLDLDMFLKQHRQMLFLPAHQYLKPCILECVSSTSINSVIKSGLGVSNCLDMVRIKSLILEMFLKQHRQMLFLSAHQYLKPCTLECVRTNYF